ncbi:MAG: sigma-70 family RNA polymerase sigma factor [Nannocystaceae bacterium]|nr:sigma-70 family RNA polymerase sigma factor [Nannocystaceae bacterium]
MDAEPREALELEIREACDDARLREAATHAIKGYGPEILGYLAAMTRSESDAAEVFSTFCEDLWRGLPGFRWASSFRTWSYALARHALSRYGRDPSRRPARNLALSEADEVFELAERVRSTTMVHLRTAVKNEFAVLREKLEPDDRTLLVLRVDRRMAWSEIARVMWEEDGEPDSDGLKRNAAALRKRFERAKERLRRLAKEANLLKS